MAVLVPQDLLGLGRHVELHAALLERLAQQLAGGRVELAFHQAVHQVNDGDVHALLHEAIGRLETEQPAADDHRLAVLARRLDHGLDILDVAEADHAVQIHARDRQHERLGAGGDQQAIVFGLGAILGDDLARCAVDANDLLALVQGDAVFPVPVLGVEHDVVDGLFRGQHRRQHDAVVVAIGLVTEHGDLVLFRLQLEQLFHGADARHPVSDHYQALFHWNVLRQGRSFHDARCALTPYKQEPCQRFNILKRKEIFEVLSGRKRPMHRGGASAHDDLALCGFTVTRSHQNGAVGRQR